jgi:quinol monooxygenase YgiN
VVRSRDPADVVGDGLPAVHRDDVQREIGRREDARATMLPVGFVVELRAKPGKQQAVAAFLADAEKLVDEEPGTLSWFAFRSGPTSFGIFDVFDVFDDEANRDVHLHGEGCKALEARGEELFGQNPSSHPSTSWRRSWAGPPST